MIDPYTYLDRANAAIEQAGILPPNSTARGNTLAEATALILAAMAAGGLAGNPLTFNVSPPTEEEAPQGAKAPRKRKAKPTTGEGGSE